MGLFGNKRDKGEKGDKNESSKGARSGGYGPPALIGNVASPFFANASPYFDGFAQVGGQGKMGKYGKYPGPSKSLYGVDPMQQAMFLPPQAGGMFPMQQYMAGQGVAPQFAGVLPPIQMPFNAMQQAQPYFQFPGQQVGAGYFDPTNGQQQAQAQGAFAPYQQPFYDPLQGGGFAGAYGYMPSAF